MRLLLDTHSLLWWLLDDSALSAAADAAISNEQNEIFVSAASAWEIATKHRIGKLPSAAAIVYNLFDVVSAQGFGMLPISFRHGETAGKLPGAHRDPFDRILIAQAMLDDLVLVSNEQPFDAYAIRRLW